MKPLTLTLALMAGFLGGALSHSIWPQPVQAQPQTPKEIRARSFVLEDANGRTLGTFSIEMPRAGNPIRRAAGTIRLFDERGREVWRTPSLGIVPATE